MNKKIKNTVICVSMAVILFSLSALCVFMPKDDFLDAERRKPAEFPEFTLDSVMKDGTEYSESFMSKFEKYAVDAFPFRDSFRTLKALFSNYVVLQKDNNGIYLADGYASKLDYPLKDDMIEHAASRFEYIYKTYLEGKTENVYLSVVPDKNVFLADKNGYPSADYDKMVSDLRDKTGFAEYIDIFPLLSIEDYYKTDTHWKQENITDVADKLLDAMGNEGVGEHTVNTLDNPFYGVYYGQSALPLAPDTIKYLTNDTINGFKVTIAHPTTSMPISSEVYNMEKAYGKDPYEMYLSGATPYVVIENPNATSEKELILFRDSFGSSIAPLLAESYAKVTLIDIRYVPSTYLGNMASVFGYDFENADVLFLYSTLVLNSSKILN